MIAIALSGVAVITLLLFLLPSSGGQVTPPEPTSDPAPGVDTSGVAGAVSAPTPSAAPSAAPDPEPSAEGDLDEPEPAATAQQRSSYRRPAPPASATAPPGDGSFNRGVATAAAGKAAAAVKVCKRPNGPTGAGRVTLVFVPSGSTIAIIGPPFAGTPVGDCIRGVFGAIRVSPFVGRPVTANKSFVIP